MKKILPSFIAFLLILNSTKAQSTFLDPSFGNAGIALYPGLAQSIGAYNNMVIQADAKILVQSVHSIGINQNVIEVYRFLSDGSLDPNFGNGGSVEIAVGDYRLSWGNDIELLPNGKILFGYHALPAPFDSLTTTVIQLNSDGSYDATFGINGRVSILEDIPAIGDFPALVDVEVQSNGRIVLVYASRGSGYSDFGFRLLRADGSILFGYEAVNWWFTADIEEVYGQALVQPDDKILVGGMRNPTSGPNVNADFLLERFEPSTYSDDDFGLGAYATLDYNNSFDRMYDLLLEPDGKILTCGTSANELMIAKFLPNGAPDLSFGTDAKVVYPNLMRYDYTTPMARSSDGKFVVIGRKLPTLPDQEAAIARFLPSGSIDTTFSPDGLVYLPFSEINLYSDFHDVAIQPDRRILACGMAFTPDTQFFMVRLLPEPGATVWYQDLDGDGYGNALDSAFSTQIPMGYVADNTDCDDQLASVHPGATEICGNGIDDNCDGISLNDTIPPIVICVPSIKLKLDSTGMASLVAEELDNGSYDDCGDISFSVDNSVFACVDFGVQMATLTVTDNSGNSNTCQSVVKIADEIGPIARCLPSVKILLDDWGLATLAAAEVDNGSTDNCGILSFWIDSTEFNCAHIGTHPITLFIEDIHGNLSSCESTVKVADQQLPTVVCHEMLALGLNSQGTVTFSEAMVDAGSYDNCSDALLYSLDINSFDCSNLGLNDVILEVQDAYGNINACVAVIMVSDKVAPVAVCVDTLVLQLDDTGLINLAAEQLDQGSYDNCDPLNFQVSPSQFSVLNLGFNTAALTVSDASGNETTCTSTIEVIEKTTGVLNPNAELGMLLYPNPSKGRFDLQMSEGQTCEKIRVYNVAGQLILEEKSSASQVTFDLSDQAPGCYYLRVQAGEMVEMLKLMLVR